MTGAGLTNSILIISFYVFQKEWLSKGHGEYREIPSERDFFQEVKESKNVVCHFYRDTTFRYSK